MSISNGAKVTKKRKANSSVVNNDDIDDFHYYDTARSVNSASAPVSNLTSFGSLPAPDLSVIPQIYQNARTSVENEVIGLREQGINEPDCPDPSGIEIPLATVSASTNQLAKAYTVTIAATRTPFNAASLKVQEVWEHPTNFKSKVWKIFQTCATRKGFAKCKLCNAILKTTNGLSSLDQPILDSDDTCSKSTVNQSVISFKKTTSDSAINFDKACMEKVINLCIENRLPYSFVESDSFRDYSQHLLGTKKFKPITRQKLKAEISLKYEHMKEKQ